MKLINIQYLIFSFCNCSHALTIKLVDDDEIIKIQNFVRKEMNQLLDGCKSKCGQFDDNDKQNFFGRFHSNPEQFQFSPGDILLIKQVVSHVRSVVDKDGPNQHLSAFKPPKRFKISSKETYCQFGCTFFGKKKSSPKEHKQNLDHEFNNEQCELDLEVMKAELLPKLRTVFELKDASLVGKEYLQGNNLQISKNGNRITALVKCVFCYKEKNLEKNIIVQFDTAKNKVAYWNLSNLRKHLNIHVINSVKELETKTYEQSLNLILDEMHCSEDGSTYSIHVDDDDMIEVIESDFIDEESVHNTSGVSAEEIEQYEIENIIDIHSVEYKIYQQVSQQHLYMTNAYHSHSEKMDEIKFILNGKSVTLNVIRIDGNGDCLFSSAAHQMFGQKVNSAEHQSSTSDLRAAVVKHIEENFGDFLYELKGRVYEERDAKQEAKSPKKRKKKKNLATEKDCRLYLKKLKKSQTFGGAESLKAITQIHSINIFMISELGPFYFPCDFNQNLDRTIILAYRLKAGSATIRNHYDSFASIEISTMCDCIQSLAKN